MITIFSTCPPQKQARKPRLRQPQLCGLGRGGEIRGGLVSAQARRGWMLGCLDGWMGGELDGLMVGMCLDG